MKNEKRIKLRAARSRWVKQFYMRTFKDCSLRIREANQEKGQGVSKI